MPSAPSSVPGLGGAPPSATTKRDRTRAPLQMQLRQRFRAASQRAPVRAQLRICAHREHVLGSGCWTRRTAAVTEVNTMSALAEIERRFLIDSLPHALRLLPNCKIEQGYVAWGAHADTDVRVRRKEG